MQSSFFCGISEFGIFLVGNGFEPDVFAALGGDFYGEMLEPAVLFSAVPMLDPGGDVDHVARAERTGGLAPFLIPALSGCDYEDLTPSFLCLVDVPIVAAGGFKCDVGDKYLLRRQRMKIAFARKILRIGVVACAYGKL